MRAQFVNPFLQAASEVLASELGAEPTRGGIALRTLVYTSDEVTAVVRVSGAIAGRVLLSMNEHTARAIVTRILGEPCLELDLLAVSGIGELGNVVTGRAAALLAEAGYPSLLEPPRILIGRGTLVAEVETRYLVIPLESAAGPLEIQVALSQASAQLAAAA